MVWSSEQVTMCTLHKVSFGFPLPISTSRASSGTGLGPAVTNLLRSRHQRMSGWSCSTYSLDTWGPTLQFCRLSCPVLSCPLLQHLSDCLAHRTGHQLAVVVSAQQQLL